MFVALIAKDKPGALDVRKANRDAHLAYADDSGLVKVAGPFLDSNGDMIGSLLILEAESMAEAETFAENDPYAKAGLFASVSLQEWKKVRWP